MTSIPVMQAEQVHIEQKQTKSFRLLESLVEQWQTFEDKISENVHALLDFIENFFHGTPHHAPIFNYDVTLVGFVNYADGIGRHPILFKECLENHVKINFLSTRNIPHEIEDAQLGLPRLDPKHKKDIGAVAILTDILADKALNIYTMMPKSHIKVAYTMFEATDIPYNWASILNKKFDMAVVPDPFLVDVYKNCGVKIPIFVLPLPLMLHDFLKLPTPQIAHNPFVFGVSGGFWERKNHVRVLEAFAAEFGNRQDVKLRLHGRFGEEEVINELKHKIQTYNLTNVELIIKPYTRDEYLDFFKSLDCYVFLSKGEGFSVTPREALAGGIPCILTKNTAQITICDSGAVRVVPSNILVPALYDCHYEYHHNDHHHHDNYIDPLIEATEILEEDIDLVWRSAHIGYQFDCTVHDASKAMRDVYENYHHYLKKAAHGREWVKRYVIENLSKKYVSLVKPQSVILGDENFIGDTFLITNSKALYKKYQYIIGCKCSVE